VVTVPGEYDYEEAGYGDAVRQLAIYSWQFTIYSWQFTVGNWLLVSFVFFRVI